jgi:small GTP-binding protein
MGNDINHKLWYDKKKRKVLLLGLPKSGKTAFYEKLTKKGFLMTYTPTVDANIADVIYNNLTFILFDLSGGERQRIFWRHHFIGTQGVIFFIDIAETEENLTAAVKELKQLLSEKELKGASFLIYLNKIDLKSDDGKISLESLTDKLDLKEERKDMRLKIELCSISKGEGIKEGMDWLSRTMSPL